jgi:UDP-N-acetyl-D-glucosamine dehydrogenase
MSRLEELKARIASHEAHIGVIGLGYVGLPLAIEFTRAGNGVTGFDVDQERVQLLAGGTSYIEDVPSAAVAQAVSAGKFTATTDFGRLSLCDVINVCVPTPLTKAKDPDVSHMAAALEEIRKRLRAGQLIILGSTTYPGTAHELFVPMLESTGLRCGVDFALAFAPERIDPANTRFRVREVPKVVGGETPLCTELGALVFEPVFDRVVRVSSTQSAEMVKLLENTFRAINIGLANEVALMCHRLGLDVWEVIEAAATKPYGFMKFLPGPGLGGHCIPVDPTYLSWKMKSLNFSARFIELAAEINGHMPEHVMDRVTDLLNEDRLAVNGARILVLGVAYKANVSDMRESPALDVIRLLASKGAEVSYHDPHVREVAIEGASYKSVDLGDDVLASADLVVVVTDHAGVDYARVAAKAHRIFDTRNAMRDVTVGREKIRKL